MQVHTRTTTAMPILMRPRIVMAVKRNIKTTRGHHISQARPDEVIQGNRGNSIPQYATKTYFFSLVQFLFNYKHFSLMFPRQEGQQQEQQSFF